MSQLNKDHFENICRILHEISMGNLGYRLRISKNHVNYNHLAKYINLIGEGYKQYRMDRNLGMAPVSLLDIYLSKDFIIEDTSQNVPEILDKKPGELRGRPFEDLLGKESAINWAGLRNYILIQSNFRLGIPIYFKVNKWLCFSCFCYIFHYPDGTIRVSTYKREYHTIIEGLIPDHNIPPPLQEQYGEVDRSVKPQERNQIHSIAQYIEEHLDDSLLNIKALASHFGINEKKLAHSFKMVFQQTPYAYYTDLKLQKAMKLLVTTNLSIDEVATSVGYSAKSSFYLAFKRKFSITPGAVQREA